MIKLILSTRAERCEKPHMPSQFGRAHDDDELPGGGGGGGVRCLVCTWVILFYLFCPRKWPTQRPDVLEWEARPVV